jgi:subtilisin family serine protease
VKAVRPRDAGALAALVVVGTALLAGSAAAPAAVDATPVLASELRSDVTALLASRDARDPRLDRLVAGHRKGQMAYFVVLGRRKTDAHRAALERAGARILREYRTIDAFAVASLPRVVKRVAALPDVARLAPVEVIEIEAEQEVDQSRATTADVGAPPLWNQGITGTGIRIAVLDTGLDPSHPDLDDLDFRRWSSLVNPPKIVDARNFVGGGCVPLAGLTDGHGHGTHVAGIATGTGEGAPADSSDNGRYAGIAPDAELAVAKVLTDAGAGLNSDLLAAMEWAATPAGSSPCSIGAHVVNLSLGSESRPGRLNTGSDVDLVSLMLNRLAVRYGTLFVAAAGNSGPFIGSVLEAPGSAAQALSVAASAKDYDVNHDDSLSGDTCAGYQHSQSATNDCSAGGATQPPSLGAFSSRGPSGDVWLRPDISAPGYNIVSAQAAMGLALAQNDLNRGTRTDPLYATATGTSMATPATGGSAALLLQAYRDRHGGLPSGSSGLSGLTAPAYALVRAALMNTAGNGQYEARWILSATGAAVSCPPLPDPLLMEFCSLGAQIGNIFGNLVLYEVRNGAADPYVGPLGEGAGKLNVGRALAALRDGVVVYSAASGSGQDVGTGPRDLQGSWQIGAIRAGVTWTQSFVLHAAPGVAASARFEYTGGRPSDGSTALPAAWVKLPGSTNVRSGRDALVKLKVSVPSSAPAGMYTGSVLVRVSNGQTLQVPVFASVALHDVNRAPGNPSRPQSRITSARDVYAKGDTTWPSVAGSAGTGAGSDWLVYPVELDSGLSEARFSVYDAAAGDETYDLYLYRSDYTLLASTHPFAAEGVTDPVANDARGPSTASAPQRLTLAAPAAGRYYVVVSRAKVGGTSSGDFGAFMLALDEVAPGST